MHSLKEQEKKEMKSAFDSEVDRLKNSPEFSHLKMIEKNKNSTVAAVVSANIRLLLKQSFPGVKFSVKKNNYDAVTVKWECVDEGGKDFGCVADELTPQACYRS